MNASINLKRLITILFICLCTIAEAQSPFSKDVKRILFLGNSITYAGGYVVDLETYFIERYPNQEYEMINVGLPSETVSGLSEPGHAGGRFLRPDLNERLDRVLAKTRPDIVFACYGMNDGIYLPLDEERFKAFKDGINRLQQKLVDARVKRIIHLTPSVHDDKNTRTQGYNRVLDVYTEWLLTQVKEQKWEVIDLHGPMTKYLNDRMAKDSSFRLAKDGVHPGVEGHWCIAKTILKALKQPVDEEMKEALLSTPKDEQLYSLVTKRQEMMKDAWLGATGHTRPDMKAGLPLKEASKQYRKIQKEIRSVSSLYAFSHEKNDSYILDMVHHNPGEPLTQSVFNDPKALAEQGYTGQVMNDFTFAHAAITFKKLNPDIFPEGSKEWQWVMNAAETVRKNIKAAHSAGIKVYYFTDIIVLPKKLVELYRGEICDSLGRISFERPRTLEIHKIMLDELFETFPDLDGLVIRTGETYLNNVPYHTGNNPITNGVQSHIKLINLLREEVCVKRNKTIFYRTWSFGGMHESPEYYLNVVNNITPHPQLIFSIKHTRGDYLRTFGFNPTLTLGNHPQIVEVQCQREYEGKGAYPNYVMNGVINGFEEYETNTLQKGNKSLNDIKNSPNFKGVWSWSRGGGWVGPYISNEFWCKLNAYVIAHWAANTAQTEEEVFNRFMDENGIRGASRKRFRELCLLSAKAVLRGHYSSAQSFESGSVTWMRDEFLGGIDSIAETKAYSSEGMLYRVFSKYNKQGLLQKAVAEKYEAVTMWQTIEALSRKIIMSNKADQAYVRVSCQYGLLLHKIIAEGWNIMALGFEGDQTGVYDKGRIKTSIENYDRYWKQYEELKKSNPSCATLYKPYAFVYTGPEYHLTKGMGASVDKYRKLITSEGLGVKADSAKNKMTE